MTRAILVMTYGSPEEYTEGVVQFFTNIRRGKRPHDDEINLFIKKLFVN